MRVNLRPELGHSILGQTGPLAAAAEGVGWAWRRRAAGLGRCAALAGWR